MYTHFLHILRKICNVYYVEKVHYLQEINWSRVKKYLSTMCFRLGTTEMKEDPKSEETCSSL